MVPWSFPRMVRLRPQFPLQGVLTLPFIVLLIVGISLSGYFCYQNGRSDSDRLVRQLMTETGDRIEFQVQTYLKRPHRINQLIADAIALGQLPALTSTDPRPWEQYFWHQIQRFEGISTIALGTAQGGLVGSSIPPETPEQPPSVYRTENLTVGDLVVFTTDTQGNPQKPELVQANYDARLRPWYDLPAQAGTAVWSDIYQLVAKEPYLSISAGLPLYDEQGSLSGVLATDIILAQLNIFLNQIESLRSGVVFLMDAEGLLVASSTEAPIMEMRGENLRRLAPQESGDRQIQKIAEYLSQKPGGFDLDASEHQVNDLKIEGDRYLVYRAPLRDDMGLDWQMVIVLPETAFISQPRQSAYSVLMILGVISVGIGILGVLLARSIAYPFSQLSRITTAIAQGRKIPSIPHQSLILELDLLAQQLRQSFLQIEAARSRSEAKFAQIFRANPDPTCITDLETGEFLEVNHSFAQFVEYPMHQVIGRTSAELCIWQDLERRSQLVSHLRNTGWIKDIELSYTAPSGRTKIWLISAEVVELEGRRCILSVGKDITNRKRIEQLLKGTEARNRAVLSAIPDLMMIISREGTYLDLIRASDTLTNLIDLVPETVNPIGKSLRELLPPMVAEASIATIEQALDTGRVQILEQTVQVGDRIQYEELRISPIDDYTALVMIRDIGDRKQAEAALRASEVRYQEVVENLDQLFFVKQASTGQFFYINPAYEKIWGRSRQELYENPEAWLESVHPEDLSRVQHSLATQNSGSATQREYRIIHPNGEIRWIFAQVKIIRDDKGQPDRILGFAADITARKQAELNLRNSEELLRQILENSDDLFFLKSLETGELLYVNSAYETIWGRSPEEVYANPSDWLTYIHPEDRDRVLAGSHGEVEGNQFFQGEYRIILPDGSIRWIADKCFPIYNAEGQLYRFAGVNRDITAYKQVERSLQASEARFRSIIEQAGVGIVLADARTGQFLKVNQRFCDLLGYTEAELLARNWQSITHPDDLDIFWINKKLNFTSQNDVSVTHEKRYLDKAGNIRWANLTISSLVTEDGDLEYHIGIIQDIGDRKAVELERQQLQERLQFVLASTPAAIFTCKADGDYGATFVSENVLQILGYEAQQFINVSEFWASHIHPDDRPRIFAGISQLFEQGCHTHEYRFLHQDRTYHWIRNGLNLVQDEQGNPIEIIGYLIDINELKQAELALQASEANLSNILNSVNAAITSYRVAQDSSWHCNYVSSGCEQVFGYTSEEFLSNIQIWRSCVFPADLPLLMLPEQVNRAMTCTTEYRFEHKQHGLRWLSNHFSSHFNESTQEWLITIVDIDISDRKATELELETQRLFLQQVLDSIPNPVVVRDENGRFLTVNRVAAALYGVSPETMIGQREIDFRDYPGLPEWFTEILERNRRVMQTRRTEVVEDEWLPDREGNGRWLQTLVSPFVNLQGKAIGIVSSSTDISDRKYAEETLRIYERIISTTSDAVLLIDRDYRYWLVNQTYLDWCGMTLDQVIGCSVSEKLGQERFETQVKPYFDRCLAGETIRREIWFTYEAAGQIFLSVLYTPYREIDDTITAIVVTLRDVTSLKQAEAALQLSEARKRAILAAIPDLMVLYDRDGFYRDDVTPRPALDLVSRHVNPMGKHLAELVPWEIAERKLQYIQQVIDTREIQIYEQEIYLNDRIQYEEVRIVPCEADKALVMIRDISDRKQAELALEESEARNQLILDTIPDLMILCSGEGIYLGVIKSNQVLDLVVHPDPVNHHLTELMPPDVANRELQGIQQALLTGEIQQYEQELRFGDRVQYEEVRIAPGHNQTALVMIRDISDRKRAEQALKESEAHKRAILEAIPDIITLLDENGRCLDTIKSNNILDIVPPEVPRIGRNLMDYSPLEISFEQVWRVRQALATGKIQTYEQELLVNDRIQYEEVRVVPMESDRALVMVRDITPQKAALVERDAAEAALRTSEARLRTIMENLPGVILRYLVTAEEGSHALLYISRGCYDLWGIEAEDALQNVQILWDTVHPEDLLAMQASILESGRTLNPWCWEWRIITPSGQLKWLQSAGRPERQPNGDVIWDTLILDVSDRKCAEETVRRREAQLRQVIDTNLIGVIFCNLDGQIIEANDAFLEMIGYSREDLEAEQVRWDWMTPPEYQPQDEQLLAQIRQLQPVPTFEKEYIRKDGSRVPVMIRSAMLDETGVMLAFVSDLTERKQREQQLRASLHEKEVLLSEVHHRVKNNLQIVCSLLDLQAMRVQDASVRAALEDSRSRIYSMSLVHERLYRSQDFARIQLQDYIDDLANHLRVTYRSYLVPLDLQTSVDPDLSIPLEQAVPCGLLLNELVTNAIKHGQQSDRPLQVWVVMTAEKGFCKLQVGNSGDTLPSDFVLSDRVDSMGLRLVLTLVGQLQGHITLERDGNTVFVVTFPLPNPQLQQGVAV